MEDAGGLGRNVTVDLGKDGSRLRLERRKERGKAPCEQGLAGAGRARQEERVTAGGRNREGAFGYVLAEDEGEIGPGDCGLGGMGRKGNIAVAAIEKMVDHLAQVFEEARAEGGLGISWEIREREEFGRTSEGEQKLVGAIRTANLRAGEGPTEREKVSGDIEITAKEALLELLTGELFRGLEDGKGERKGQRLGGLARVLWTPELG